MRFKEEYMKLILSGEKESKDNRERGKNQEILQKVSNRYTFHPTMISTVEANKTSTHSHQTTLNHDHLLSS